MIKKVLVANRGEIAVRIIRACREMGIPTVAVHSDVDRDSLHVKIADESVCIGPAKAKDSYLNIHALLSAAELTQADAIHPGYGFLAENADFAEICERSKILFIGPDAKSIRTMGDKILARNAVQKVGVPVLPGTAIETQNPDKIRKLADQIGYPIILKAAFGGGGRGMKIVRSPEELIPLLEQARTESAASFGKDAIYIEKYISSARHIEFQVIGDKKGNIAILGERDCTIQRRHQKLIEESTSPAVSSDLRREMCEMLGKSMRKLGYSNVGTLEFLMDEKGKLYFIEMNTRVQVEHTVTEMITGIDIVKRQIELADGADLGFSQKDVRFQGHSLECRINAEDPLRFRPSTGTVEFVHLPAGNGIRVDTFLYNGYKVLPFYDSLLAKLIVHGKDRMDAIRKMKSALSELVITGVNCNADFHKRVMDHPDFISGEFDTGFAAQLTEE